jgi:hypothetical protein
MSASFLSEEKKEPMVSLLIIPEENGRYDIFIQNPEKHFVSSVRTWLAFPKDALKITNLNLNNTFFNLAAPGEFLVDTENGFIKIGLSKTEGTRESSLFVGSFEAENLKDYPVPLQCYNYQKENGGHCLVLGENLTNILLPFDPLFIPVQ